MTRRVLLVSSLLLPLACSGCITASLATIGTVLGALGSAASTGSDVYKLGKLESALRCSADECHRAVLLAAGDLSLHVKFDRYTKESDGVWDLSFLDDEKAPVGIHIEGRTNQLCYCKVDVGIFGSEPTARLFQERLRHYLPHPEIEKEKV